LYEKESSSENNMCMIKQSSDEIKHESMLLYQQLCYLVYSSYHVY